MRMIIIECKSSKAQFTTLTLSSLTARHLVPRLHCVLDACQQWAHVACHIGFSKRGVHI